MKCCHGCKSPGFNSSIIGHGGQSSVDQSVYKSRSIWLLKKFYKSSDIYGNVSSPYRGGGALTVGEARVANPHHFKVDPDPALLQSDGNLRPPHPSGLHLSL